MGPGVLSLLELKSSLSLLGLWRFNLTTKELDRVLFVSFLYALTLLFIALKLTSFIAWNWLLILSPILVPAAIGFAINFVRGFKKAYNSK
jgi:hypothetical protein